MCKLNVTWLPLLLLCLAWRKRSASSLSLSHSLSHFQSYFYLRGCSLHRQLYSGPLKKKRGGKIILSFCWCIFYVARPRHSIAMCYRDQMDGVVRTLQIEKSWWKSDTVYFFYELNLNVHWDIHLFLDENDENVWVRSVLKRKNPSGKRNKTACTIQLSKKN